MAYTLAKKKLPPNEWLHSTELPSGSKLYWTVFKEAEDAKNDRNAKKWRYTKDNGEVVVVREKLDRIVKALDTYAKIVDVAIQHNPEITALVWAGARFLLQVSVISFRATRSATKDTGVPQSRRKFGEA
jgi:hypothetical protein